MSWKLVETGGIYSPRTKNSNFTNVNISNLNTQPIMYSISSTSTGTGISTEAENYFYPQHFFNRGYDSNHNFQKRNQLTSTLTAVQQQRAEVNSFLDQFQTWSKEEQAKTFESMLRELPQLRITYCQIIRDEFEHYDMISMLLSKGMNHIAEHILSYLDDESLIAAEEASERYREVVSEGMLWKKMIERKVTDDNLWRMICIKRGWMDHLFKPKLEVPNKGGSFYKHLYLNLRARCQNLELNWRESYNSNSTIKIHQCNSHMYGGANCVQFDDDILVCGFNDRTAKIYSTHDHTHIKTLRGHVGPVSCLQFDASVIMTGSMDRTVKVWNILSLDLILTLEYHTDAVYGLRFNDFWLMTCSMDYTLVIWERIGLMSMNRVMTLNNYGFGIICVDFNSKFIVAGTEETAIKVWDMETWKPAKSLYGHEEGVECLQLRGRHVVSGSYDMSVRVWDVVAGLCLQVLEEHDAVVGAIRFSDKYIVSGSKGRLVVWDFKAIIDDLPGTKHGPLCLQHIMAQEDFICGLYFDEFKIVSGSKDDTIMVYEFINLDDPQEEFEEDNI